MQEMLTTVERVIMDALGPVWTVYVTGAEGSTDYWAARAKITSAQDMVHALRMEIDDPSYQLLCEVHEELKFLYWNVHQQAVDAAKERLEAA